MNDVYQALAEHLDAADNCKHSYNKLSAFS